MVLLFKNKIYRYLTLSRLLNTLGSSFYNIVFVIYAANRFHSKIIVSLANLTMVVPTLFTVFIGIKADKTIKKSDYVILTGFLQAGLFTIIALIINEASFLIFSTVSMINIISDILSDYANGLKMPIIQKNVDSGDLVEAYSFSQFITYFCQLSGQALGVWLLTYTQYNFAITALLNALSFLLSACILLPIHKQLTLAPPIVETHSTSFWKQVTTMITQLKTIFQQSQSASFGHILVAIVLLNALRGSSQVFLTSIYYINRLQDYPMPTPCY